MWKKILIVLLIVLAGAGAYYFYTRSQAAKKVSEATASLKTAALETGVLETGISATGRVRSQQTADLTWGTSGIVATVDAVLGDSVKPGDVLANLAQSSLPQAVIKAQSDLFTAQEQLEGLYTAAEDSRIQAMKDISTYEQELRDAQYQLDNFTIPSGQKGMDTVAAVAEMKVRLDAARKAFEPYRYFPSTDDTREDLLVDLNEAQADYDSALKRLNYEYELEVAQSNLKKAHQNYQTWKGGPNPDEVESVQAAIAAAEAALSQSWIEAPFGGTITRSEPKPGDKIASGDPAFRIDDLTAMFVDVSVSEVDIDLVQVGQPAKVTFDALRSREFLGEVVEVAPVSQDGETTVNFTVSVQLTDPDPSVRPGMTAEVEIIISRSDAALLIPNEAVRTENGSKVVYLMKPGGAMVPVEISLGASSDQYSELVSGELKTGDLVVLNPAEAETDQRIMPFMMGGPPPGVRNRSSGSQQGPRP